MYSHEKLRITAAEMYNVRGYCGIRRIDRIRNEEVLRMGNVSKPIVQKIDEQVLRWFGHVERMSNECKVKSVYESDYSVRRARG